MNSENIVQLVQKGFHVTLGATNFFVETLQDPQKRDENVAKLSGDFTILSEEWAVEGAKKEQEARQFVDSLLGQQSSPGDGSSSPSGSASSASSTASANIPGQMYQDLKELTTELAAIRSELQQADQNEQS